MGKIIYADLDLIVCFRSFKDVQIGRIGHFANLFSLPPVPHLAAYQKLKSFKIRYYSKLDYLQNKYVFFTYSNIKHNREVPAMPGGWSFQSDLTPYDSFIFYNAIGKHNDYFYVPIAVAKQIVNGTNYQFICIAEPRHKFLDPHFAVVNIYKPINGDPYTTSITAL